MAIHTYLDKRKTEGKNPRMTISLMWKNVRDALTGMAATKMVQRKRLIQKLSSVILIATRHNFRKRNILKEKQKSVIR